jgi:leucine dehydrogenase
MDVLELVTGDFEQLQVLRDDARGVLAFVAIHDTRCGPAFGGIRRWQYRNPADAAADALRLAEAMTWKCALSGVAGGGGKTVIASLPNTDRRAAYELVGRYVEEMGGRYYTGPDIGTEESDLELVARHTRFVAKPGDGGPGNLAEPTALGVFRRACVRWPSGSASTGIAGLRVVVQGLGEVGRRLVERLCSGGALVTVADVNREAVAKVQQSLDVSVVDAGSVLDVEADVFSPCALGGVIHDLSLESLKVRAIAGSANNVLAAPEHGRALHERGVLYAPDFLINSGALVHGALFHLEGEAPAPERIERIGDEVGALLDEAKRTGVPPAELALRTARERVAAAASDLPYLPAGQERTAREERR